MEGFGHVLMLWVISLPFYSALMYLYNVFASMRKFHIFAVVNCLMVIVQCVLYSVLCNTIGLAGVPAADFVFYAGCCVIMLIILHRYIGDFGIAPTLWTMLRVIGASAIGLAAAWAVTLVIPTIGTSMVSGLLQLIVAGCVGLVVTFVFCYIFRVPEMKIVTDLLSKLKRKITRK